jgi:hypothetical protein
MPPVDIGLKELIPHHSVRLAVLWVRRFSTPASLLELHKIAFALRYRAVTGEPPPPPT